MAKPIITNMFLGDELLSVHLEDRISVPTKRTLTDAGQMLVPCKFARTGTQLYSAKQLGLVDLDPKKVITVYRDEKDVFDESSMDTFRSAPVTIGHPKDADGKLVQVSAANAKELQVGVLEGMPVRDEDTLGGVLVLTAKEAIDALEDGTQELSAGYTCDIEEIDGKYYQRNIRANHIAIVAKGRAGSSCRISDEAEELVGDELLSTQAMLNDAQSELLVVGRELEDAQTLVKDLTADAAESLKALEAVKLELADAKVAAEEGVVERCEAIENARLIADMRDLGSKSVAEIERLVVEDQMPEKDFTSKSDAYISAMFEILVDSSKGTTPMGELLKQQESHVVVDAKPIDPVEAARQNMIKRNSAQGNK